MWLQAPVLAFTKRHSTSPVLSAYVTGGLSTPTMRSAARVVLRQQLDAARDTRHVDGDTSALFDRCATLLEQELPTDAALHRLGAWYCFVSADGDLVSGSVPECIDASVSWDVGPDIAPLLAAGGPTPVFVLLLDQEHARLCRLEDDGLVTLQQEEAEPFVVAGDHMGTQPRQGFHHGTAGETLTDRAQRRRRAGRARILTAARHMVESTLSGGGVLVIGGSDEATHAFIDTIPAAVARRSISAAELRLETGAAKAAKLARAAQRELADREISRWFAVLKEERAGTGRSAIGPPDVERALVHGDVAKLALSRTFTRRHARGAHRSVLRAIAEGAEVFVASRDAATLLDEQATGIAAELRFALPPA